MKEGVAQSQVYSVIQDSRGLLWMGTRGGGITKFDGLKFKTYTQKDGLPSNYIFCIKENWDKRLWIGTDNGISVYNGVRFINHNIGSTDTAKLWVLDMAFDKDSGVWLATNQGVIKFKSGKFEKIGLRLGERPMMINTIHCDNEGNIWYGNALGLSKIQLKRKSFQLIKFNKSKKHITSSVNSIRQSADGTFWIGTYKDGLYICKNDSFKRVSEDPKLSIQSIFDIYFDDQNNVWMATLNSGVAVYNTLARSLNWISEEQGLSNNHVRSVTKDKSGNFWFGTSGGGVCNYFGNRFTTYDKSSGLGGNFIYSIFRNKSGKLFIGTSDKGITILDSGIFKNMNSSSGFEDLKVKAFCQTQDGSVLIGTEANGVYRYVNDTIIQIEQLTKKYVRSMLCAKNGDVYIATAGMGIYILKNGSDSLIQQFTISSGLLSNRISCLHEDKKGRIWYGTENHGIGNISNYKVESNILTVRNGLPSNSIRCFTEDKKGLLWIGTTGSGIISIRAYESELDIQIYDYRQGLSSSNIYLLTTDENDRLFVGTETGLDQIEFDTTGKITNLKHFSKGEGFVGIETCQNSVFKDADGIIWFGTINGLIRYSSKENFKNLAEPVTSILDIRLFYEPLVKTRYASVLGDWNTVKELVLPYDQNHLTFDFIGINFNNPEAVSYRWKLEGFDADWSPVSKQNTVTYSNLPYGEYTFLVISCNEEGIWNKVPVRLHIVITPPYWMKPWVIMISIMFLSLIIILLFRWRISHIRKKAGEAQEKLKLEKEFIELEQKALRLQMNPHFIFNALNSIQSQIGTGNEDNARYYLAKFSRLMRQILDNSRSSEISLQEEISTLENYLLIEKFCNGERFDYSIDVDPSLETDFIYLPPMLLQPFIENAIKHGLKHIDNKRGIIKIEIRQKNDIIECSVTDNGIGRDKSEEINKNSKETYHKSTAMAVTKERLDLINTGRVKYESLEIIDLKDSNGEALGTKVIIRLPLN